MIFFATTLHAKTDQWPDANDYNFIEYEVKLVSDAVDPIDALLLIADGSENDKIAKYIINYEYDIKKYKTKIFTIHILKKLNELAKSITDLGTNTIILDYINKHENSTDYTIENIWNKFIVWAILDKYFVEESYNSERKIYVNFDERRVTLLNNIAKNNSECGPLAQYILTVIESPIMSEYSKKTKLINKQKALQTFINEHPKTEYAACAYGGLIECLGLLGETSEAELTALKVFNQYENFYTVNSNLYNDIYKDILLIYYNMRNPDQKKIKFYLSKLNKKVYDYDDVCAFFKEKLEKTEK